MSSVGTTIAQVRAYAAAQKLKPATLAKLAGLHANALRDMFSDTWNPRADTLQKVEAAITRHQIETNAPGRAA